MPQPAGDPSRWSSLEANADLGLSVPSGVGHRFLKRVVARLCRPFLVRQVAFNRALLAELVSIRDSLVSQIGVTAQPIQDRLAELGSRVEGQQLLGAQVERQGWAVEAMLPVLEKHGYAIDAITTKLEDNEVDRDLVHQEVELAQQQSFARMHDGIGMMRTELVELDRRLAERTSETQSEFERSLRRELDTRFTETRWRLAQVDVLLDVVRRSLPEEPPIERLVEMPGALENLYGALEEAMRGSHETIIERVRPYLDDVLATPGSGPVLDVGCGRGEWLEVLRDSGVEAYGVELNPIYQEAWDANQLDVRIGDVRDHLTKLGERSLRVVSALHVAEHLTTDELIEFLDLALRALEPGGVLILETPNPENLLVGSWSFYLDPTHRHPLPARLLSFLVGSRGFSGVEVRYLARPELELIPRPVAGQPWETELGPLVDTINRHLFAPQDYAVIARRL
ncbi:MAG: hypothetical protein JWO62_292 [Acidimicrobiaceae bacterium]|nr:hypothetical protein [Acidimicrobiaceae bacterium]